MLSGNVRGFFQAGSDTVRTTLEWLILALVGYPDVQERMAVEIEEIYGRDSKPSWADRSQTPYCQAVLAEVQRFKTVVPLNLPRRALEDVVVQGKRIPRDTQVLANFWSVHNDPQLWTQPELFNPDRFLSADKTQFERKEFLMTFSYGKRSCPGESLALVELYLFAVCLIQKYRISLIDGQAADFTEQLGITAEPKTPVQVVFTPRA